MKNKGFTIVELLAVIVILGILSSIALVSVSKYRKNARDTDLLNLHGSVEVAYDKYRQDMLTKGKAYDKEITFNNFEYFDIYFSDFTFDGKHLTKKELEKSSLKLVVKGDLLNNTDYKKERGENDFIKDGTCMVESSETEGEITNSCKTDESGNYIPSQEEMLCITIYRNAEVLIDDFSSDTNLTQRPLCEYFAKDNDYE